VGVLMLVHEKNIFILAISFVLLLQLLTGRQRLCLWDWFF